MFPNLRSLSLVILIAVGVQYAVANEPQVKLDLEEYDTECGIEVSQHDSLIHVTWPLGTDRRGRLIFDLTPSHPLIALAAVAPTSQPLRVIATGLDPVLLLRVGTRDLDKRDGWTIFFDRMQNKPSEVHSAVIDRTSVVATSNARRATLTIGDVSAGPFKGKLRWTFYANTPFVLQEAILATERVRTAYLYDTGLVCQQKLPTKMQWTDSSGSVDADNPDAIQQARHLAVKGRAISAEFEFGSIALFPPPHRYFYPLDFSVNLKNIWMGPMYNGQTLPFGFGIRHDPSGDNRYAPWINAPPKTTQHMGLFLLFSDASADQSLQDVSRLTRSERFAPLAGHTVFSSHYHVEHTREVLAAQENEPADDDQLEKLSSGGEYRIPQRLKNPGFARTLRDLGVDIVHLAEFHSGKTPGMTQQQRVRRLELLHAECLRLSDDKFLMLPGEEPNVHFGGHWISLFPNPVNWVLNRPEGTPFVVDHPRLGRVYHVGGKADVLRLLRAEGGLAWTAHARIKSSTGFPDRYRDELFFQSDRFLGAAWKAMPADLSQPRLGSRVLDLLDDMSNWGDPKYVLGEVDVFKIEPDHELYAHMNVNYLRLEKIPRFEDGWQPVLDALRRGQFFVTTGEVLIPEFTVNGRQSGELATVHNNGKVEVRVDLQWTFPLTYAEIITGDGHNVKRQRIDLSATESFGKKSFKFNVDVSQARWLRIEVWDIATNGAFTQPVWLKSR